MIPNATTARSGTVRYWCRIQEGSRAALPAAHDRLAPNAYVQLGNAPPRGLPIAVRSRDRLLSGYPIVWVRNTRTNVFLPYWTPRDWLPSLYAIAAREGPVKLPQSIRVAMSNVGALDGNSSDDPCCRDTDAIANYFSSHRWANFSSALPRLQVEALAAYFDRLINMGTPFGDKQCARRYGVHNDPVARFFHCQFAHLASAIVGEPVIPSYSYFVDYREGASLAPHTDRDQCAYTMSVLIKYEPQAGACSDWPICLDTPYGTEKIFQVSGDALLFGGRHLPHWRPVLPPSHRSASLLMHFVPEYFTGDLR